MVSRILALILALACTASLSTATMFQGHVIRGKVRNSAGQNMPRVMVDLQTGTGSTINQTVTNNEGDFQFSGLFDNSYYVVVSSPDYNPISERVEFVRTTDANSPGETRTIEITLAPRGSAPVAAPRSTFAQNIPKPAHDSLDQGLKLSREGKPQEAIAAMQEAIRLFPDYFDAHFALANEMIKTNQLNEAIAELQRAREINPKDDRVYQSFGAVLTKQGKYLIAARVFGEAAKLNPNDPQIALRRCSALIEYAATLDPSKSKEIADERARAFEMAEKELNQTFEASGRKLSSVHLQLARLYEKKGDRARAANELEQYLRMTPDAKNADAIREAIKKLRSPSGQ